MKHFLKKITGIVPAYGFFPLVFSFVFNCLVYSGSRAVAGSWYHHNIESNLDLRLPFLPQFLIIYFGCYISGLRIIFWQQGRTEKKFTVFLLRILYPDVCA